MRIKNKGYTLVELLLSIAVFAIVMVGIASIMSSTLKAYSNANIDIAVQEDCQMAANQLEELLCDAKSISPYDASVGWQFQENDGTNNIISYDGSKVQLTKGGSTYTIADHVSSFDLDNWNASSDVTGSAEKAYNQIVINMTMNNNDNTYSLKRDVYFRNDVENKSFHGINNLMSEAGSTGSTSSDDAKTLIVKRYQEYNLTADYQITVPVKLLKKNSSTGGWDVVTDPDGSQRNDNFFVLKKDTNAPADSYEFVYYLTTGASVDTNFGLSTNGEYRIEGTGVKIDLKVDAVEILDDGVVIQHHKSDTVNSEGFTSPVNVKGININDALNSGEFTMKARYKIVDASGNLKANYTDYKSLSGVTDGIVKADSIGTSAPKKADNTGDIDTVAFGMGPDPFLGGLSVFGRNDPLKDNDGAKFLRNNNDLFFVFSYEVKSRDVTQSIPDSTFKFNALGNTF